MNKNKNKKNKNPDLNDTSGMESNYKGNGKTKSLLNGSSNVSGSLLLSFELKFKISLRSEFC